MSTSQSFDGPALTVKSKKPTANPPAIANPGPSQPTTFFLKSDKDMEQRRSPPQRGRTLSKSSRSPIDGSSFYDRECVGKTGQGSSSMADSNFGVQSLEDAMSSAFGSDERDLQDRSLSRTDSNISQSEAGAGAGADGLTPNSRKRKAGNPVHPKIQATGQRIISSELPSAYPSTAASPVSFRSSESPYPYRSLARRGSVESSVNMSQPLTPLRLSPHPESSGLPGTPRSGSPKSFRLSDEEAETGSQAVASSDEEDYEVRPTTGATEMPQLVMPSLTLPARRPFTEKGKSMGRLKVMVVGARGVGKTSLIDGILRSCEDVVHVDSSPESSLGQSGRSEGKRVESTKRIAEVWASTKPKPEWWDEIEEEENGRRRRSVVDGKLERNICFVDTPGLHDEESESIILGYLEGLMKRGTDLDKLNESEMLSLFSGDGGIQVDAILYVFGADTNDRDRDRLLRRLSEWTIVIPVINRSDTVAPESLREDQAWIYSFLLNTGVNTAELWAAADIEIGTGGDDWYSAPFAVSTALDKDAETMDASTLMSSQYVQPIVPSDLPALISTLMNPTTIARLRHLSAKKLLAWRRSSLRNHPELRNPQSPSSPSFQDPGSNVLVPHSDSSFYRSINSSYSALKLPSNDAAASPTGPSTQALLRSNYRNPTEPPNVVIAKWAQDLQRGNQHERDRYREYYQQPYVQARDRLSQPNDDRKELEGAAEKLEDGTLVPHSGRPYYEHDPRQQKRPKPGKLGGPPSLLDPSDPLNLHALSRLFRRRGFLALQICGGVGIVGTVVFWAARNWAEVQEFCGFGDAGRGMVSVPAVPAPGFDDRQVGIVEWVGEGWAWAGGVIGEALGI